MDSITRINFCNNNNSKISNKSKDKEKLKKENESKRVVNQINTQSLHLAYSHGHTCCYKISFNFQGQLFHCKLLLPQLLRIIFHFIHISFKAININSFTATIKAMEIARKIIN